MCAQPRRCGYTVTFSFIAAPPGPMGAFIIGEAATERRELRIRSCFAAVMDNLVKKDTISVVV